VSIKVYIRGAYGPGNLGDDVLLVCMVNIIKEVVEPKNIYVGVEDVVLAEKLQLGVKVIHYKIPMQVDAVVYGGGGQFFSFKNSQKAYEKESFFSRLSYFISQNRNPYYAIKRLIYSKDKAVIENLIKTKHVASFSIGIGPFESEGKGFQRLKKFSSIADFVSLRDKKSHDLYKNFFPNKDLPLLTTDPSFNSNDWFTKEGSTINENLYEYTYIIREWPYSETGRLMISNMIESCRNKHKAGIRVRLVALFKEYDKNIIQENDDLEWLVYDLNKSSMSYFLGCLVDGSKYIISARAHGVWLPTILGKPVLSIGIENKLEQVAISLGKGTCLSSSTTLAGLEIDITKYINEYDDLANNIPNEVKGNRDTAIKAREALKDWLKHVEK
jgi:polysaccharide pyruvyl transferase WcaK-like protein